MNHTILTIVATAAAAIMAVAFYLDWYAWSRYKSDQAPARLPTWNPKYWRPPKRSWFCDERGLRINRIARLLYGVGGVLGASAFFAMARG